MVTLQVTTEMSKFCGSVCTLRERGGEGGHGAQGGCGEGNSSLRGSFIAQLGSMGPENRFLRSMRLSMEPLQVFSGNWLNYA